MGALQFKNAGVKLHAVGWLHFLSCPILESVELQKKTLLACVRQMSVPLKFRAAFREDAARSLVLPSSSSSDSCSDTFRFDSSIGIFRHCRHM